MKKITSLITSWWPLIGITLVGAFFRLYKISLYMTFLGDEGRDVLIVKRMLVDGKWTLLGPTASVGGFFMGPIYYYFMAPFLWLWHYNPVGPAIMVALVGIATIILVYLIGNKLFGRGVAIVSSCLYAISPLIIAYSRSSWNPNVVPFFSILLFYLLFDIVVHAHWKRVFWVGMLLGILLQLHYTTLALFGVTFVWFLVYGRKLSHIKHYIGGVLGFLVGFSPFLAFEVRHGFMNIRSIVTFVFEGKDTGFLASQFFANGIDVYFRLFGRLLMRVPEKGALGNVPFFQKMILIDTTWVIAFLSLVTLLVFIFYKKHIIALFRLVGEKRHEFYYGIRLIILWLFTILVFFGFYKKAIYDYYFGMMYFIPFFLVGLVYKMLYEKSTWTRVLAVSGAGILIIHNLFGMPFRYEPNNQLGQVELIAEEIIKNTDGKPFNFALITGGNSDHSYRYFFELWGRSPVTIENSENDPERKTVTDQLLIVCEDLSCQPLGNSLWEVAGFGRAEIDKVWSVSVVRLYRLVHYKGE